MNDSDTTNPTVTPELVHKLVEELTAPGAAFEITEKQIAGVGYRGFTHAPGTLLDILDMGRGHGASDFLVFEGERWSFERFFAAVDTLAAVLHNDLAVAPGDRVAIAMRNCPDWLAVFAAAVQVGAVVVPINSWGSSAELEFTLRDCGASVLAADLPRAQLIAGWEAAAGMSLLFSDVDGPFDGDQQGFDVRVIHELIAAGSAVDAPRVVADPADLVMLPYTSGSTGHPKGVQYRNVVAGQALMNMLLVGYLNVQLGGAGNASSGRQESSLLTVPLFHATGLVSGLLLPCMLGSKVVLMRKWEAETALKLIESERVTIVGTVPAILKDLLTHPAFDRHDVSSIMRVSAAGAATPADLPDLLRDKLGIVARSSGYGMTETTAVGATMSGVVFDLNPLSSGIPAPIIEMRMVAADKAAGELAEDGEIQVRGITVMPGYWQLEELNSEAFTSDGWFRTGDLGHLDDDGFLHVTGRIKEIVIRGGENIAPVEIENAAYLHPGVKEVAVVGIPDDAMGEELAMVCHPVAGSVLTEAELRQHLSAMLPKFKVPKHISLSDVPLPRNVSEKIHRLEIRQRLLGS